MEVAGGMSYIGLNLICHLDLSALNVTTPSLPFVSPLAVFIGVLFSVLFYSSCTLPHSAPSFHLSLQTITFVLTILNFFSLSPSSTSH